MGREGVEGHKGRYSACPWCSPSQLLPLGHHQVGAKVVLGWLWTASKMSSYISVRWSVVMTLGLSEIFCVINETYGSTAVMWHLFSLRWGANKEDQYKKDMVQLLHDLRTLLPPPRTLIIWTTTMPVATERVKGGVFIKQVGAVMCLIGGHWLTQLQWVFSNHFIFHCYFPSTRNKKVLYVINQWWKVYQGRWYYYFFFSVHLVLLP